MFFLFNINKRRVELGDLNFTIKRTLNKTTITVCLTVLVSWIVMVVLMMNGKLEFSQGDESDYLMFAIIGLATATVFATTVSQFVCKTGFYSTGIIAGGNILKYKDTKEAVFNKKKNHDGQLYELVFLDTNTKNRGSMLCDEDEKKKIENWLKKRAVSVR